MLGIDARISINVPQSRLYHVWTLRDSRWERQLHRFLSPNSQQSISAGGSASNYLPTAMSRHSEVGSYSSFTWDR